MAVFPELGFPISAISGVLLSIINTVFS